MCVLHEHYLCWTLNFFSNFLISLSRWSKYSHHRRSLIVTVSICMYWQYLSEFTDIIYCLVYFRGSISVEFLLRYLKNSSLLFAYGVRAHMCARFFFLFLVIWQLSNSSFINFLLTRNTLSQSFIRQGVKLAYNISKIHCNKSNYHWKYSNPLLNTSHNSRRNKKIPNQCHVRAFSQANDCYSFIYAKFKALSSQHFYLTIIDSEVVYSSVYATLQILNTVFLLRQ